MVRKDKSHAAPSAKVFRHQQRIIFGRRPIEELLRHCPERVEKVYCVRGKSLSPSFKDLIEKSQSRNVHFKEISEEVLSEYVLENDNHQGVIAFLNPTVVNSLEDLIKKSQKANGVLLALDQIYDPQNLGAIFRVADGAGIDGVLITDDRSADVTPSVVKASSGASEFVPWAKVTNLARALRKLKDSGFWIIGTSLESGSQSLWKAVLPHPCVFVLGSEEKGLRRLTKDHCDILVNIPLEGFTQSLNVSHAAAVVLFEFMRRSKINNKSNEHE